MDDKNDGGPAFPSIAPQFTGISSDGEERYENAPTGGMTLRDYFAAKALPQAWAAELAEMAHFNEGVTDRDMSDALLAKRAYRIADAMLKAREA